MATTPRTSAVAIHINHLFFLFSIIALPNGSKDQGLSSIRNPASDVPIYPCVS
jgi:hypothetical protein